jgi:hypothetical protein
VDGKRWSNSPEHFRITVSCHMPASIPKIRRTFLSLSYCRRCNRLPLSWLSTATSWSPRFAFCLGFLFLLRRANELLSGDHGF